MQLHNFANTSVIANCLRFAPPTVNNCVLAKLLHCFVRSFLTSLLTAKKINTLRSAPCFLFFFLLFGRLIFVASQQFDCIIFSVRLIKIRLKRVFFAFWWIFCAICVVVFIFFVILP